MDADSGIVPSAPPPNGAGAGHPLFVVEENMGFPKGALLLEKADALLPPPASAISSLSDAE